MAEKRDYYEVLGLARDVNDDDIKRAYRKLAMQFHPDRNLGDPEAQEKFKEATEAYQVLSDPERRGRYDRYGHAGLVGGDMPHFGDAQSMFGDFLGDIFGDFFGQRRRSGPQAGRDLEMVIEVELVEAAKGTVRSIPVPRQEICPDCSGRRTRPGTKPAPCRQCKGRGAVYQSLGGIVRVQQACPGCGGEGVVITDPCPACHGRGRMVAHRTLEVSIPPGVDTGTRIRHTGEGEAGEAGAPRGDLYIAIRVKEHPFFQRDGIHLICQVPITFSQAALGGSIDVPTLDGPLPYTLKRGVQSGEVVRVSGKGMPSLRGGRQGDLMVQVVVETPRHLAKRQEELFRELAELEKKHVSPQRKSFLDKLKSFFTSDQPEAEIRNPGADPKPGERGSSAP